MGRITKKKEQLQRSARQRSPPQKVGPGLPGPTVRDLSKIFWATRALCPRLPRARWLATHPHACPHRRHTHARERHHILYNLLLFWCIASLLLLPHGLAQALEAATQQQQPHPFRGGRSSIELSTTSPLTHLSRAPPRQLMSAADHPPPRPGSLLGGPPTAWV